MAHPELPIDSSDFDEANDRYLTSMQVRARYGGASDMWLWRRRQPDDTSGFPKALEICGRRFWKLSDLVAWERSRAKEPA